MATENDTPTPGPTKEAPVSAARAEVALLAAFEAASLADVAGTIAAELTTKTADTRTIALAALLARIDVLCNAAASVLSDPTEDAELLRSEIFPRDPLRVRTVTAAREARTTTA